MKQSTERILTTHTGSLPRPDDLLTMLYRKEKSESQDQAALEARVRTAVATVVRQQLDAGVDVVNDGEVGRISYATYVKDRLSGFEGEGSFRGMLGIPDLMEFPEYGQRVFGNRPFTMKTPACTGPITYKDKAAVRKDL